MIPIFPPLSRGCTLACSRALLSAVRLATVLWSRQGPWEGVSRVSVEMWRTWWRGEVERPPFSRRHLVLSSIVRVYQARTLDQYNRSTQRTRTAPHHSPRSSPHVATSPFFRGGVCRSNNTGVTSNSPTRSCCLPRKNCIFKPRHRRGAAAGALITSRQP